MNGNFSFIRYTNSVHSIQCNILIKYYLNGFSSHKSRTFISIYINIFFQFHCAMDSIERPSRPLTTGGNINKNIHTNTRIHSRAVFNCTNIHECNQKLDCNYIVGLWKKIFFFHFIIFRFVAQKIVG